jgi:ligand-binding sensor domain-containing protein
LSPSAASTITTADGAPQSINTIYQDPRGELFVTALNGKLFRVARQTLAPVPLPAPLGRMAVRNLFRDSHGMLWIGTDGQGVARIDAGRIGRYTMKQGLVNDFIRAFCEDREGGLWIGTDGGLSRFNQGAFQNFDVKHGLVYQSIRALLLDRGGDLWVATDGGLSRMRAGRFVDDPALKRLRGQKVWSLYEDAEGKLWIGTHGAGLFLFKDGAMAQFTTKAGLPSNKIHFIIEDAQGSLWMSGPSGIVAVSRREIESLSGQSTGQLAVRVYSAAEGLSTNQMNGGVQPAGAMLASVEMWFPSAKGAGDFTTDPPAQPGDRDSHQLRKLRRSARPQGRKREEPDDDRSRGAAERPPARVAESFISRVEIRPWRLASGNRRRRARLRSLHHQLVERTALRSDRDA